jgi:hypothetical protein
LQKVFVFVFTTIDGIRQGLDYRSNILDDEDCEILLYTRQLSLNLNVQTDAIKKMAVCMNARRAVYTLNDTKTGITRVIPEHRR